MKKKVILIDEKDKEIGEMEKIEAHKKGLLHRAFSVFIFNSKGEILLQKRSKEKYHSGGLWTNTCCSHPSPGEETMSSAKKRLKEEMGIETEIKEVDSFIYRKEFENGLIEHEYDHIFVGFYEGKPLINREEVSDWKWVKEEDIKEDIKENPYKYTYWFVKFFKRL